MISIESAAASHPGRCRPKNEDAYAVLPEEHLYLVADGMGGYECGEVASRTAVDALCEFFKLSLGVGADAWPCVSQGEFDHNACRLQSAVLYAHRRIGEKISHEGLPEQMGTTIVALHIVGGRAYVAHVGDSRCYLLRRKGFRLLTADHTMVSVLAWRHRPGVASLGHLNPYRHILTRALGGIEYDDVRADVSIVMLEKGDTFLLCSDGLYLEVPDQTMQSILEEAGDLQSACRQLVQKANDNGGRDNITVVLVRVTAFDGELARDLWDEKTEETPIDEWDDLIEK